MVLNRAPQNWHNNQDGWGCIEEEIRNAAVKQNEKSELSLIIITHLTYADLEDDSEGLEGADVAVPNTFAKIVYVVDTKQKKIQTAFCISIDNVRVELPKITNYKDCPVDKTLLPTLDIVAPEDNTWVEIITDRVIDDSKLNKRCFAFGSPQPCPVKIQSNVYYFYRSDPHKAARFVIEPACPYRCQKFRRVRSKSFDIDVDFKDDPNMYHFFKAFTIVHAGLHSYSIIKDGASPIHDRRLSELREIVLEKNICKTTTTTSVLLDFVKNLEADSSDPITASVEVECSQLAGKVKKDFDPRRSFEEVTDFSILDEPRSSSSDTDDEPQAKRRKFDVINDNNDGKQPSMSNNNPHRSQAGLGDASTCLRFRSTGQRDTTPPNVIKVYYAPKEEDEDDDVAKILCNSNKKCHHQNVGNYHPINNTTTLRSIH